jgi:hypothetical protein
VILGMDGCSWGRTGAPGDGRVFLGMDGDPKGRVGVPRDGRVPGDGLVLLGTDW